jgi:hypothetical protein
MIRVLTQLALEERDARGQFLVSCSIKNISANDNGKIRKIVDGDLDRCRLCAVRLDL